MSIFKAMKQYSELILNPFLLALLATFLVLLIFPLQFPKYTTDKILTQKLLNDAFYQYEDLDGDGNSEKIGAFHNSIGIAAVTINRNGSAITQINLHGTFNFGKKKGRIMFGDRDSDGWKEIYIFTLAHDTVLLHCIDKNFELNPAITNKFVARCGISNGKLDPYIIEGTMDDLNEDGTKELIFGITTGFSLYPRQIYAFDMANDSIWTSPYNGYFLSDILQTDITGDGKPEIIPHGYAASNVHDTTLKYHDRSSWLMVLDRKLQFLFEPVEFEGGFSNVWPFVFRRDGKTVLMAAVCPPMHKGDSAYLITFTKEGQISDKTILKYRFNPVVVKDVKNSNDRILFSLHDTLELYDAYFKLKKKVLMENIYISFTMDIDDDGNDEIIVSQINISKLTVFRNDLTHPVEFRAEGTGEDLIIYSVNRQKGQPAEFAY